MYRNLPIKVFSTCPQSREVDASVFVPQVVDVARWSDEAGCEGTLIYTDNSLVDPWMVAQVVLQSTQRLCPLIAVQPAYMHPYTVAKMVASYAYLHGRRVYLNMVAGGFVRDLRALDDDLDHDGRYARLVEYTGIVKSLLWDDGPVSVAGHHYRVTNLRLTPRVPVDLLPGITVSGSSSCGRAAAQALDAIAIEYPREASDYELPSPADHLERGIRIGIIARPDEAEAWAIAWDRFPADRRGQLTHLLAMRTSDSVWHRQLSDRGDDGGQSPSTYWLHPFQNYKTFCPYLVGSYDSVGMEIARYLRAGIRTFILDIPRCAEDLEDAALAFGRATRDLDG